MTLLVTSLVVMVIMRIAAMTLGHAVHRPKTRRGDGADHVDPCLGPMISQPVPQRAAEHVLCSRLLSGDIDAQHYRREMAELAAHARPTPEADLRRQDLRP
jgi:hypothetical protein